MAASQVKPVKEDVWIKTFCHGCLSATCALLVHRVDGVVVGMRGDPDNPFNEGRLCPKAYGQIMDLYNPTRPTKPLIRTNPEKGIGVPPRWKEVSWEEALDLAARKLAEVHQEDPSNLCLSTSDVSAMTWMPGPIVGSFGSHNMITCAGHYCATAVHNVPWITVGSFSVDPDIEHCNYLVLWGANYGGALQHHGTPVAMEVADARLRGMKLVCIDPVQASMAAKADEWLPIRPSTDLVLALAWLNVLLNEAEIYDRGHIKQYTNGPYLIVGDGHYLRDEATKKPLMWDPVEGKAKTYDAQFQDVAIEGVYSVNGVSCKPAFQILREHVASCTPEWASPITSLAAKRIRRVAREFGEAARIGSTIVIDGQVLPWRPAAIYWYCGISQHVNGYITGMAIQLINTVVGNLNLPGGMLSDGAVVEYPYGEPNLWTGKGAVPGEIDGIFRPSAYSLFGGFLSCGYPPKPVESPKSPDVREILPVGLGVGHALFDVNNLHPERFNYKAPRPKVLIGRHASDLTNKGNPQEMAQIFKNFYQISCEPIVDETAEFADIFLPTPVRLERLQIGHEIPGHGGGTLDLSHYCINLSQPVVDPSAREMMDIWSELAERIGILSEYNQMINVLWDLKGDYRLDQDKKHTYREMQERLCKSMFGPEYDLERLAGEGHVSWRKSVREKYPRPFIGARSPIYYEHLIDAGRGVAEVVKESGFEWDVADYKPLPVWRPGPALRETKPGFDLLAVPFRVPFLSHMWTTHNPWLVELAEHHPWAFKIIINVDAAAKRGIKDGDRIVVEGATGYEVEGVAKLTQCIHPEVVALSRHGGHWCSHPVAKGKGTHFNTLVPHETEYIDPMYGGLEGCIRVRVTKGARR